MMNTSQDSTASQPSDRNPALSRRAVMSRIPGAAMALMVSGAMADSPQARGRGHDRRSASTVEVLPDGVLIELENTQVLVQQVAEEEIAVEIALLDDLTNPIYRSLHSGVLTEDLFDQIVAIGRRGVGPDDVHRYFAMLRGMGLTGVEVNSNTIAVILGIIIAIIIICAIIGASFGLGYEDGEY